MSALSAILGTLAALFLVLVSAPVSNIAARGYSVGLI